jgi:hypothetical protein
MMVGSDGGVPVIAIILLPFGSSLRLSNYRRMACDTTAQCAPLISVRLRCSIALTWNLL